jgi:anti-sigma B factor antagonist
MPETNAIEVTNLSGAVVVKVLLKDLDEPHIKSVRDEMAPVITASPNSPFILDMSLVKFIPSLTLGQLVKLLQEFKSRGQRFVLASLQPTVRQVFAITRLDRLFEIQPDPPTAAAILMPATSA